jgi:hypothetical protein
MTDRLKYVTAWKDRHGKRRYFFRAHGQKYPLPGAPGGSDFHAAYAHLLAELEANTLGRHETAFIKGTIGWVIEHYLKDRAFTGKAANTQRNYRRVLDHLKVKLGPAFQTYNRNTSASCATTLPRPARRPLTWR